MSYHKGQYVKTKDGYVGQVVDNEQTDMNPDDVYVYRVWVEEKKRTFGYYEEELQPAKNWQGLEEGDVIVREDTEYKILKRTGGVIFFTEKGFEGKYPAYPWRPLKELEDNEYWKIKDQEQEEENQEDVVEKIMEELRGYPRMDYYYIEKVLTKYLD